MRHPHRVRAALLAAALGFAAVTGTVMVQRPALAFPKPSLYPISWEIKFKHSTPKRITYQAPGDAEAKAYWYMTYSITNFSDADQDFLPTFDLFSRDGKEIPADKGVPAGLSSEIKKRERNNGLESLQQIAGKLRVGEDQTREGVAIWPEPSTRMGTFHVYVSGLSGEAVILKDGEETKIKDWTKVSEDDLKKQNILRKTADITFQVNGDGSHPDEQPARQVSEEWVMR